MRLAEKGATQSRIGRGVGTAQRVLRAGLAALGGVLEARPSLALGLLLALYVPLVLIEAHAHPLSSDEIYTVHIARAPTMHAMWWMEREIDLHPPLHYLLVKAALDVPGPMWLVARLPSMVAGAVATGVLFWLAAAELGSVLGLVAAAVLWTGPLEDFFWSDRPYMVGTALLLVLVAVYLQVCRRTGWKRVWGLVAVAGLSALMVADQLIGIAWLGAFAGAEVVRAWRRRRADWAMEVALFAPVGLAAGFVYQVRHLEANGFPAQQIPSLGWAASMYNAQVTQMFFLLSVTAVAGAFLWPGLEAGLREERPRRMDEIARALFLGLVLVPVVLMVVAVTLRLQYWERYSACAVLGFAGLIPWMLYRRLPRLEVRGPLLVLVFVGTTVAQVAGDAGRGGAGRDRIRLGLLDAELPIVAANPITFTEMSDREAGQITSRLFYLTDRAEAQRVSGYTLFENESKIGRILGLPSHAEDARTFYGKHPHFWLVADPNRRTEWLLRSLVEQGATVAWKGSIQPGYDDSDLYLVSVPGS